MMNCDNYVFALLHHVNRSVVYFPSSDCLLCEYECCILDHRIALHLDSCEHPCYICLQSTSNTDHLLCSHSHQHRLHYHCLKQQRDNKCGVCRVGEYGTAMNYVASLHVLFDKRHMNRHELANNAHHAIDVEVTPADVRTLKRNHLLFMLLVIALLVINAIVGAVRKN